MFDTVFVAGRILRYSAKAADYDPALTIVLVVIVLAVIASIKILKKEKENEGT
jgi:uncharacterized membrane protein